jgi:DNA-binding protein HU-beta
MNKNDLVSAVAASTGLSKTDGANAIDSMLESIAGELRLPGFGTFSVAHRKASEGRNPRTGEPIKIPASNLPKFKAGKSLKEAVN